MANFAFSALALKAVAPSNDLLMDDKGMPSCMVYIPKFKLSDVLSTDDDSTHPAFIVNGTERPGFWIGKFQSKSINGRPYALPCEDPTGNLNLDTFVSQARAKGSGWHEITAAEWGALAIWCHKNGFEPKGNNKYGKDVDDSTYKAIPQTYESDGRTAHVASGTGPVTWSHDGTMAGVWDLNGNMWEWCTGVRLVNGEIQIIEKNNACDNDIDLSDNSGAWKAIKASDGSLINPDGNGTTSDSVKLDYVSNTWKYSTTITSSENTTRACKFWSVSCDQTIGEAAKLLLQSLALLPDTELTGDGIDSSYGNDEFFVNNMQHAMVLSRGGHWFNAAGSGIFSVLMDMSRIGLNEKSGGRIAFIENP